MSAFDPLRTFAADGSVRHGQPHPLSRDPPREVLDARSRRCLVHPAEVNRNAHPFERAAYHCKYVLERALAREDELTPAGVLQQKIAEFGPPRVEIAGEEVQFTWLPGSIKRKDSADGHGGKCVVLVLRQYVVEATLDGRSLHAGFSF